MTVRRWLRMLATTAAIATVALAVPASITTNAAHSPSLAVIVRALPGAEGLATDTIEAAGGTVHRRLDIIGGLSADIPAASLTRIEHAPGIHSVVHDGRLQLMQDDAGTSDVPLDTAIDTVGARAYWSRGYTGEGVDVALIDSGVAPVEGLTAPGKVVNGADLSFESQDDSTRYVDTFGHGTHLAGIIAGRDDSPGFVGIAPGARLVSVKVADAEGAADVSQVIAAIDWVVQHRRDFGLDIRVLALAFGTDGTQDRLFDPLAHAVEVAWRQGIVVVVAAGNDARRVGPLRNPATNPFVVAVGADDTNGTAATSDDMVPSFSNRGDGQRDPDFVTPGVSLVSLRAPGSTAEQQNPDAAVGDRFIRGSGTSQATAVAAGASALVIQQRPDITPDQVKALLKTTARKLIGHGPKAQGAGVLALDAAIDAPTSAAAGQGWGQSRGTGSLEGARGSVHVQRDGVEIIGERDIFEADFDSAAWAPAATAGSSWSGGMWNGSTWTGSDWSGSSWSGSSWSSAQWSGSSWSGSSWSGSSWSGSSWSSTWG